MGNRGSRKALKTLGAEGGGREGGREGVVGADRGGLTIHTVALGMVNVVTE